MFGTASRYMRNGQFQPPGGPSTQMTPAGPGGYQPQGGGPPAGGGVAGGGMAGPAGMMGGAFAGAGPGREMPGGGAMAPGMDQMMNTQGGPVQAAPPQFGGGRTVGPGGQPMPPGGGPPSGPIMAAPPSFGPGMQAGGGMQLGLGGAPESLQDALRQRQAEGIRSPYQQPGGPGMQAGGGDFTGQMPQGPQTAGGYNVTDAGTQKALGAGGNLYDPTQGGRAAGGGGQFEKNDGMIQTAAGGLPPRLANAVSEGRMSLSQAAQRFGKFQDGTLGQGGQAPGQTEPAIGQGGPPPPGQGGPNPGVRPMGPGGVSTGMTPLGPGQSRPRGGGPAGGGVVAPGAGGGAGASGAASGGMAGGSLGGNMDKSKISVRPRDGYPNSPTELSKPGAGKGPMPINKPRPGGLSRPGVQPGGGNPTGTMVPGPGGQPPGKEFAPSGPPPAWMNDMKSPGPAQGPPGQSVTGDWGATTADIKTAMPRQAPTTATPDIGGGQQSPMAQALQGRQRRPIYKDQYAGQMK